MNSSGNVGIKTSPNNTLTGLNTIALNVVNNAYIGYSTTTPYIKITSLSVSNGKIIRPSQNNTSYLGSSGYAFRYLYAYYKPTVSDSRKKENIKTINNSLEIVRKLNGVKYDYKKEFYYVDSLVKNNEQKDKLDKERKNKLGFLAQDVQKVLPEVVMYVDSTDTYFVNYEHIIPVLVEAMKEQQGIIDDMANEIKALKNNNNKSAEIGGENVNALYQNSPNPFNESSVIRYELSESVQSAMLNIYNMNGTQLKSIAIHETGSGSITINGSEFGAGMYMYALIADGTIVDTKNMVLTD